MKDVCRCLRKSASWLAALVLLAGCAGSVPPTPLEVHSHQRVQASLNEPIMSSIQMLFGADQEIGAIDLVVVRDPDPFGESYSSTDLVQVEVPQVTIQREDQTRFLSMFLVFESSTGRLLVAYTIPSEQFLKSRRSSNSKDPEEDCSHSYRGIAALPTSELKSKLPEVLSAFWRHSGLDPGEAGQLILRPRSIDNDLPGRSPYLGQLVPTPGFKPWWVIQLLGYPPRLWGLHHRELVTQYVYMFVDEDLETGCGNALP